jgi:hypothetical protein
MCLMTYMLYLSAYPCLLSLPMHGPSMPFIQFNPLLVPKVLCKYVTVTWVLLLDRVKCA